MYHNWSDFWRAQLKLQRAILSTYHLQIHALHIGLQSTHCKTIEPVRRMHVQLSECHDGLFATHHIAAQELVGQSELVQKFLVPPEQSTARQRLAMLLGNQP